MSSPQPIVVLSSGTTAKETADAIKLLIAARLSGSAYQVSFDVSGVPRGRAPALIVSTERVLTQANAAVRCAHGFPSRIIYFFML